MPRETTEEEEEEDDPLPPVSMLFSRSSTKKKSRAHFEVANKGIAERVGVETVLEDGRRDVRQTREHDDTCITISLCSVPSRVGGRTYRQGTRSTR